MPVSQYWLRTVSELPRSAHTVGSICAGCEKTSKILTKAQSWTFGISAAAVSREVSECQQAFETGR